MVSNNIKSTHFIVKLNGTIKKKEFNFLSRSITSLYGSDNLLFQIIWIYCRASYVL